MVNRSLMGRLVVVLLVLIGGTILAVGAYHAGLSTGLASTGGVSAAGVSHGWGYGWSGAYGFPWFFFWPIFPLFFILLVALLIRAAFWGRGRGGWDRGPWGPDGYPGGPGARLEEWHRRVHEANDAAGARESGGPRPGDR